MLMKCNLCVQHSLTLTSRFALSLKTMGEVREKLIRSGLLLGRGPRPRPSHCQAPGSPRVSRLLQNHQSVDELLRWHHTGEMEIGDRGQANRKFLGRGTRSLPVGLTGTVAKICDTIGRLTDDRGPSSLNCKGRRRVFRSQRPEH